MRNGAYTCRSFGEKNAFSLGYSITKLFMIRGRVVPTESKFERSLDLTEWLIKCPHIYRGYLKNCELIKLNVSILSTALTVYNRNSSQSLRPERNCGNNSPQSSSSDYANSTSDCDSEPDRFPTYSEKRAKKKRQRTTFSMFEVWELERAYMKRPYLMPEDEEDLEKRLGITARSLRVSYKKKF